MALGQSEIETAKRAGRGFMAWSGQQSATLTSPHFRTSFSNPTGSGSNIFIYYMVTDSGSPASTLIMANVFLNATTTVSGTAITPTNLNINDTRYTPKAVIKADVSATAVTGGTQIAGLGIPQGRQTFPETTFMLTPGTTITIDVPFTAAAGLLGVLTTIVSQFVLYWYEELI